MALVPLNTLEERVAALLKDAGASTDMARSTARTLVRAEAEGLASHGLSRVKQYAAQLQNGRVKGDATPSVKRSTGATLLVDADEGLAYPACDLAITEAIGRCKEFGIALAGVSRSHHFGPAGIHLEPAAEAGMIGFAFTNSPPAMPAWGGRTPTFGTNPIAAVFPRRGQPPLVIDLSLSTVARGKLMVAAKKGDPIPPGWALDKYGKPTTDPKAGMEGMMSPLGGAKGAMLALMVEVLCACLTGSALSYEADSFFKAEGNRPHLGHLFVLIQAGALAGNDTYHQRLEALIGHMLQDEGVRLPGARRYASLERARTEGLDDKMLG